MTINPNEDGITHINIYSKGKTVLGRQLSNFTYFPFECEDGKFASIEGYWYWLRTGNDELRDKAGFEAKKTGEAAETFHMCPSSDGFKDKICKAITIKLDRYKKAILATNLPFEHYYVYGNKVVDAGYKWILSHIENYRTKNKQ